MARPRKGNETMVNEVAQTILAQLGGNKFLAMTGAKGLTHSANSLTMTIPARAAKNKATHCVVTLNGMDTYDVRFLKIRGFNVSDLPGATGVYAADLARVWTAHTGMHTSL